MQTNFYAKITTVPMQPMSVIISTTVETTVMSLDVVSSTKFMCIQSESTMTLCTWKIKISFVPTMHRSYHNKLMFTTQTKWH